MQNRAERNRRCPLRNMSARVLALLLAVLVLAGCGSGGTGMAGSSTQENGAAAGAAGRMEGEGFATAEEAAKAYVDGLIANDIDAMLAACAIESYVDHFDMEKYIERIGAYQTIFIHGMMLPEAGETARRINIESRRYELASEIKNQYARLVQRNLIESLDGKPQINVSDYDSAAQLLEENFNTNEDVMKDIRLVSTEDVASLKRRGSASDDEVQDYLNQSAESIGADEITAVAIRLSAGGKEYVLIPDLVRYGDKWYVCEAYGQIVPLYDHAERGVVTGGLIPAEDVKPAD
ncbi:MAG: hypothetical protein IJP92_10825 [Lachnospiraceae bacterium]|nr:hypothetical protein [Lachnospiraceae bacterium]